MNYAGIQQIEANILRPLIDQQIRFDDEQHQPSNDKYKKPAFVVADMNTTFINMTKSFQYVGDNSAFQKRITLILVIQWISFSFMVNTMAYYFRGPTYYCLNTQIQPPQFQICTQIAACSLPHSQRKIQYMNQGFMNYHQVSIIEQFDIPCIHQELTPLAQSFFFIGGFISGYVFSYVSQKLGRRPTLMIILLSSIVSMIITALAPSIDIFLIGYFFVGFSLFGYQTNVYSYIGQISAIRFRTISINMLTMVFVGTPIFLPVLSLIPTWRYAFIFFAVILIATFPFVYMFILESPRYLIHIKQYQKAKEILKQMSITNQRPPYAFRLEQQIQHQNEEYIQFGTQGNIINAYSFPILKNVLPKKKKVSYNYCTLFKYPSLRKPTIILMVLWTVRFFLYFGLNLALGSILKSGVVLTIAIACGAITQICGTFGVTLITTYLFQKLKIDLIKICLLLISVAAILMGFIRIDSQCHNMLYNDHSKICWSIVAMILTVMMMKFFTSAYYSALIVYYAEVFPTPVRFIGCSLTLTFGRLGTIFVPIYINIMKPIIPNKNPLCFLAPLTILAYFLCRGMPATQQKGIQQKIQEQIDQSYAELQNLSKLSKQVYVNESKIQY